MILLFIYFSTNYNFDFICLLLSNVVHEKKIQILAGQHIYEINADPDLQGDTLNTLGEDLCVVANLKMEIRPITFTVHTTYCNESIATLCQKVTGILT